MLSPLFAGSCRYEPLLRVHRAGHRQVRPPAGLDGRQAHRQARPWRPGRDVPAKVMFRRSALTAPFGLLAIDVLAALSFIVLMALSLVAVSVLAQEQSAGFRQGLLAGRLLTGSR